MEEGLNASKNSLAESYSPAGKMEIRIMKARVNTNIARDETMPVLRAYLFIS